VRQARLPQVLHHPSQPPAVQIFQALQGGGLRRVYREEHYECSRDEKAAEAVAAVRAGRGGADGGVGEARAALGQQGGREGS
jgi:hypothetical protein